MGQAAGARVTLAPDLPLGEPYTTYRDCAQLFFRELQDRPQGPRRAAVLSLQEFLAQTPFPSHQAALRFRMDQFRAMEQTAAIVTVSIVRACHTSANS